MLIIIRRLLALVLVPVFLVWFFGMTVRAGLDRTVFDDGFLAGQLEEQDFYNWLHDDLIRVALDDRANVGINVDSRYLPAGRTTVSFADPATTRDEARSLLRSTFPPEYLQDTTAEALGEFIPYLRGDADDFEIYLTLNERVSGLFSGVRETYVDIETSTILVNELIGPAVEKATEDFTDGPFGVLLTAEQAGDAARRVAPPEWIDDQVFGTIEELDRYLSGRSETLSVNISFRDRIPVAAEVVKEILDESNADRVIFDTLIRPEITRQIGRVTVLSYAIEIEDEEITAAMNRIAPREWVRGHIEGIVDAVALYMARETDTLSYTVDLEDQRNAAVDVLVELAVEKALGTVESLPACQSPAQALGAVQQIQSGSLPSCIDPGLPLDAFAGQLEDRLTAEVQESIGARFPSSVTYDDSIFTGAVGGLGQTDLEGVRNQIADGITIDQQDVLDALSSRPDTAQRFLEIIRTDRPFTVDDFDRFREERAAEEGTDDLDTVDTIRGGIGLVLGSAGAAIALAGALLFLLVIGLLGGRTWPTRLIWAGSALLFASLVVWIGFSQVLSGYGADFVEDELVDELDTRIAVEQARGDPVNMLVLARDEGVVKARAFVDAVTGKFANYALLWVFAGAIAILAGVVIKMNRKRPSPGPA